MNEKTAFEEKDDGKDEEVNRRRSIKPRAI